MAQTILTLCDYCLARGEHVPATTWTVHLLAPGARKPKGFDVDACDVCAKPLADLMTQLSETARTAGSDPGFAPAPKAAPAKPAPEGGGHACPACDTVCQTADGLRHHAADQHDGRTVSELAGTAKAPCPHPGCERKFKDNRGVAQHQRRQHDEVLPLLDA